MITIRGAHCSCNLYKGNVVVFMFRLLTVDVADSRLFWQSMISTIDVIDSRCFRSWCFGCRCSRTRCFGGASLNTSRQTHFEIRNCSVYKVGNNILSNQLSCLNRKIQFDFLNLPFETYKIKCKSLFLL